MENSNISWTDHTFNLAWGCSKVSPGCAHCYADDLAGRYGFDVWGKDKGRRVLSDAYWKTPYKWEKRAAATGTPEFVFCSSMADVFEDHPTINEQRERLWKLIDQTPHLIWLLLTKRPENILYFSPLRYLNHPPANVWYGTSVENQHWASERIPVLLKVPAARRFISYEPALKLVDFTQIACPNGPHGNNGYCNLCCNDYNPQMFGYIDALQMGIDWIIMGGESGPKARPMQLEWARNVRDQCKAAGVDFWFKQVGGRGKLKGGHLLDGREYYERPAA